MKFIETVFQKLKANPRRVVFPEGDEPRVVRAAARFVRHGLGTPVLIGSRDIIEAVALEQKVSLDGVEIFFPETAEVLPTFVAYLNKLKRYRDWGQKESKEIMVQPNYFAAMMLQYGYADALVTGASETASSTLRPLIQLVKPLPGVAKISSCSILDLSNKRYGERGVMFFGDCAVIPEPTVDDLASIAIESGKLCRQLTGQKPRVAMLSYSTKGSARLESPQRVQAATALARQRAEAGFLDFEIDGELQADTALLPDLAVRKAPQSLVAGKANVLVFPDLNAGNISLKLVHHLSGADSYGQLLLGFTRPCAEMSRGATEDEILGVAAIMCVHANELRRMDPELATAP